MSMEYPCPFFLDMIRMQVPDHSLVRSFARVLTLPEKEQALCGSSESPCIEFLDQSANSLHPQRPREVLPPPTVELDSMLAVL